MAIKRPDGSYIRQSDTTPWQQVRQVFGTLNWTSEDEAKELSRAEIFNMMTARTDAEKAADAMFEEYEKTGVNPVGYRSNVTGMDFGEWYAGYQKRKSEGQGTDFMKDIVPVLSDDLLDERHPDMFRELLKQSGNEDFKRISVSDLINSAQFIDGKAYFDPRVITMAPGEDGGFKVRENQITTDGANQRDGGIPMDGYITADHINAAYDTKVVNLDNMVPGSAIARDLFNKLQGLDLDPEELMQYWSGALDPTTDRETTLANIDALAEEYNKKEIAKRQEQLQDTTAVLGEGTDSVTQQWSQILEQYRGEDGTTDYKVAAAEFIKSDRVIDVDENNFSGTGFLVDAGKASMFGPQELQGEALLNAIRLTKEYLTGERGRPFLARAGFAGGAGGFVPNMFETLVSDLDKLLNRGIATKSAKRRDAIRKNLMEKDFTANNIEEYFTKAQWDSLDETQKKEAFALIGQISNNNVVTTVQDKLAEVKPGVRGLGKEEALTWIKNNKNYKEFFNLDNSEGKNNIQAMFKDPEIRADFEKLSPQDFANKYSVDGKLDTKRLIGNNLSDEAVVTLNKVISKDQVEQFKELVANNDIEGIKKLAATIQISDEDQETLIKELADTGGDLRQLSTTKQKLDLANKYVMAAMSTSQAGDPIMSFLQDLSLGEFITSGMFNSKGIDAAKGKAEMLKASVETYQTMTEGELSPGFRAAETEVNKYIMKFSEGEMDSEDFFINTTTQLNRMQAAVTTADGANRIKAQKVYESNYKDFIKRWIAEVEPNWWQTISSFGFARGGTFLIGGREIPGEVVIDKKTGKATGIRINDVLIEAKDLEAEAADQFKRALVAVSKEQTKLKMMGSSQ